MEIVEYKNGVSWAALILLGFLSSPSTVRAHEPTAKPANVESMRRNSVATVPNTFDNHESASGLGKTPSLVQHDNHGELFFKEAPICLGTLYYLVDPASVNGDGSSEAPFSTIQQALDQAKVQKGCAVEVILNPGFYPEKFVTISMPTTILGWSQDGGNVTVAASIVNETDSPLSIEGITLAYAAAPGAVVSTHAEGKTSLKNVTIIKANGCGVSQSGGELAVIASNIYNTQSGGDISQGSGVCLWDTNVELEQVVLSGNALHGFYQDGGATTASDLVVEYSGCDSGLLAESGTDWACGGIVVTGDGEFVGDDISVIENTWAGLYVKNGHVDIEGLTVSQTKMPEGKSGGANVALSGATGTIQNFEISEFEKSVGLFHDKSCVTLESGTLSDHHWGIAYKPSTNAGCSFENTATNLEYFSNNIDFLDLSAGSSEEFETSDEPLETP